MTTVAMETVSSSLLGMNFAIWFLPLGIEGSSLQLHLANSGRPGHLDGLLFVVLAERLLALSVERLAFQVGLADSTAEALRVPGTVQGL